MLRSTWRFAAFLGLLVPVFALAQTPNDVTAEKLQAALPELEKLAVQTLKTTGVPGMAIVVVHKDRVVFLKGFGVREVGKDEAVDGDTVFQVASVSKPIATTLLALLVGEGVIGWDDRIIDHFPDFRLFDPYVTREVTVRDMLCHRSGLPMYAGDLLEDMDYDRGEVLHRLRFLKPGSSFRSHYAYTNFGFTAAGEAAARKVGKSWEALLTERLFRPLGMTSTSPRFKDYAAAKNRVVPHVPDGKKWIAKYTRQPDAQSPAGGVSSTARDLAQWMRLQLANGKFDGKQLVDAKALAETHRPQIVSGFDPTTNRAGFYGLGWGVSYDEQGRIYWKHSGAFFLGIRTEVALLPAADLGIAVLTNAAPTGVPEGMNQSFFDLVLKGKLEKDWIKIWNGRFDMLVEAGLAGTDYSKAPANKLASAPLGAYVGKYRNDYFGVIEVGEEKGALLLRVGPKRQSLPSLTHWDRDVFTYQPQGESAGGRSGVLFQIGPDGRAQSVRIEALDGDAAGMFERIKE